MSDKKGRSRFWHDLSVRSVKALNVLLVCTPFSFVWLFYYSKQVFGGEFSLVGRLLIIALYLFLYCVFSRVYDAFQISQIRKSEIFFSQVIAITLTDIVFYVFLFALLRSFPDVFYFFICVMVQIILSLIWCLSVTLWYFKVFRKRKAVVIYDNVHNLYEITKHIMFKRRFELMGSYDIDDASSFSEDERRQWLINRIKDAQVVFVMEISSHERNMIVKYCVEHEISCYDEPKIGDILLRSSKQFNMYNLPMLLVERYYPSPEYMFIKRFTDIILACLTLVILSPILCITALAIKINDGGPIIYKQKRLTKNGRAFDMYKFRSMTLDAEKDTGAVISSGMNDPRITRIGRFIRKYRIDELPQLINIIKGDMSIVGPRPERPEIAEEYNKLLPEFRLRLQVKAGLTGYAQVYGRYDSDPYDKLCMDLHYIANAGVIEDLRIMFVTFKRILIKEPGFSGADEND